MTNPKVMRIIPRLSNNKRQQQPLVLGQNGLGADMVSTTTPPFRETLLRVEISEGAPLRLDPRLNPNNFSFPAMN